MTQENVRVARVTGGTGLVLKGNLSLLEPRVICPPQSVPDAI